VIAATNCDLKQKVEEGRFRKDLYYRLNIIMLRVPSLRSRPEDVLILARHFGRVYSNKYNLLEPIWTEKEIAWLTAYKWPGNVRELENYIRRRILLGDPDRHMNEMSEQVLVEEASYNLDRPQLPSNSQSGDERSRSWRKLSEAEKKNHLTLALSDNSGNISAAAKQLGISRRAIQEIRRRLADRAESHQGDS
jgi:transcriptional regulator with PAS, ATPase and Fis domain